MATLRIRKVLAQSRSFRLRAQLFYAAPNLWPVLPVGLLFQIDFKLGYCVLDSTALAIYVTQIIVRYRNVSAVEGRGTRQFIFGRINAIGPIKNDPQIEMPKRGAGIKRDCRSKMQFGACEIESPYMSNTQIQAGIECFRVQTHGFFQSGRCFRNSVEPDQDKSQFVVGPDIIRVKSDGFSKLGYRLRKLALACES